MRKMVAILLVLCFTMISLPAFAAKGRKGASDRAYEKASQESIFHRVGDWFATRGKTEKEKKAMINERKAKTEADRIQKKAQKAKKKIEKKGDKTRRKIQKKSRKINRKSKKK